MTSINSSVAGLEVSSGGGSGKLLRTVIAGPPPQPATHQSAASMMVSNSIPIPANNVTAATNAASRILNAVQNVSIGGGVSTRENVMRNAANNTNNTNKAQNRHTIAISNESFENFATNVASKLQNDEFSNNQQKSKLNNKKSFFFEDTK